MAFQARTPFTNFTFRNFFFVPMNHFCSSGRRRSNWRGNLAKSRQAEHLGMDDEGRFSSAYVVSSQFFTARSLNPPGPNSKAQIFHCRLRRQIIFTTDDFGGECAPLSAPHFSGLCKNWTNDTSPSWPSGWKQLVLNILICSLEIHTGMLRVSLRNSSSHPCQIQTSQWPWRTSATFPQTGPRPRCDFNQTWTNLICLPSHALHSNNLWPLPPLAFAWPESSCFLIPARETKSHRLLQFIFGRQQRRTAIKSLKTFGQINCWHDPDYLEESV